MVRPFPPANLPHSYLQSVSFAEDITIHIGIWGLRECKRSMSRFNSSLHCCSGPTSTHFMDTWGHLKGTQGHICLLIPVTFQTWKGVLLISLTCSILYPQLFSQDYAPYGHPFNPLKVTFHCPPAWPYGQVLGYCPWVSKNPNIWAFITIQYFYCS